MSYVTFVGRKCLSNAPSSPQQATAFLTDSVPSKTFAPLWEMLKRHIRSEGPASFEVLCYPFRFSPELPDGAVAFGLEAVLMS